ncbi:sugar kinase [Streptomyces sp. H27-D2]|uniref:sugar kinase n=1 Tax=Streptomyces sp. H27-D2 TaxID=3046304 RepID=UPI002DBB325B|nr:sugar kinase [Streptomyces sp. H27-D2]MEC4017147.1 sugar kinase [Streptomyces sp. H27-D2]
MVTAAMSSPDLVDVVCVGESMVTFVPSQPGSLADVPAFTRGIGGAESNVACCLARAGHPARWLSRVGHDGFGEHLVDAIGATGVDVSAVQRDRTRPTGIYFRTAGERATGERAAGERAAGERAAGEQANGQAAGQPNGRAVTLLSEQAAGPGVGQAADRPSEQSAEAVAEPLAEVVYYRAGSAAAAMSPDLMPRAETWSGRVLHLTGITAALSADCLALMRDLTARRPGRPLVSFDVNYRVALWQGTGMGTNSEDASGESAGAGSGARAVGPAVLAELARGCDLVFVGEDEAEAAWGLTGAAAIRAALPEPATLVVKQGGEGATVFARRPADTGTAPERAGGRPHLRSAPDPDEVVFAPALRVDVVAPVGAGDAFAAGFLSATLRELPIFERIRHGHLMAAASLTVPGDLGTPPARDHADRLVALDAAGWETLRLGPGWTTAEAETVRVEARNR